MKTVRIAAVLLWTKYTGAIEKLYPDKPLPAMSNRWYTAVLSANHDVVFEIRANGGADV